MREVVLSEINMRMLGVKEGDSIDLFYDLFLILKTWVDSSENSFANRLLNELLLGDEWVDLLSPEVRKKLSDAIMEAFLEMTGLERNS